MRFISTKAHAMMDYVAGILLALVPLIWIAEGGAMIWVPVCVGILMIVMALVTDYEYSAVNAISMPAHLIMDVIVGIFLAASPWLFNFADIVWIPHVVVGLLEVGGALCTRHTRSVPASHSSTGPTTVGHDKVSKEQSKSVA